MGRLALKSARACAGAGAVSSRTAPRGCWAGRASLATRSALCWPRDEGRRVLRPGVGGDQVSASTRRASGVDEDGALARCWRRSASAPRDVDAVPGSRRRSPAEHRRRQCRRGRRVGASPSKSTEHTRRARRPGEKRRSASSRTITSSWPRRARCADEIERRPGVAYVVGAAAQRHHLRVGRDAADDDADLQRRRRCRRSGARPLDLERELMRGHGTRARTGLSGRRAGHRDAKRSSTSLKRCRLADRCAVPVAPAQDGGQRGNWTLAKVSTGNPSSPARSGRRDRGRRTSWQAGDAYSPARREVRTAMCSEGDVLRGDVGLKLDDVLPSGVAEYRPCWRTLLPATSGWPTAGPLSSILRRRCTENTERTSFAPGNAGCMPSARRWRRCRGWPGRRSACRTGA